MKYEKLLKTKYVGSDDDGKMLLAYNEEQINNIKIALTRLDELEKKEIPMKPVLSNFGYYQCPTCRGLNIEAYRVDGSELKFNYCDDCGQKLDWSDEK